MSSHERHRREFLKEAGVIVGASAHMVGGPANAAQTSTSPSAEPQKLKIVFEVNRQPMQAEIDSRTTLLDLLREQLRLTGTKKGCDQGACGACTVLVDDQRVLACLTLAATLNGKRIRTIEGLSEGEQLHPLQEAFLRCDAYQCGYCTPGQIMSALGCIEEGHATKSVEETREWMSGNLCRCSAYPNIVAAIRQAAGAEEERDPATLVSTFDVATPGDKP